MMCKKSHIFLGSITVLTIKATAEDVQAGFQGRDQLLMFMLNSLREKSYSRGLVFTVYPSFPSGGGGISENCTFSLKVMLSWSESLFFFSAFDKV